MEWSGVVDGPAPSRAGRKDSQVRCRHRLSPVAAVIPLVLLLGAWAMTPSAGTMAKVAVFPVENLTSGSVPAAEVTRALVGGLTSAGVGVVSDDALEAFMARHRIRYAAGIDAAMAARLREETGADGAVFASVEWSSAAEPPKIALLARLASTSDAPTVVWADDVGLSGDDAPGLFELGLVNDYQVLLARALDRLAGSLTAYLKTGRAAGAPKAASKFRPKTSHRQITLEPGRIYSIAVVPFFNLSERRQAGQILALLFARHLAGRPEFRVVEPGVTRRQLLDARIIMDGGISLSDADAIAAATGADLVLGGRVFRYEDYEGPDGRTRVDFSTMLVDRRSGRVVWSSASDNEGTDGVLVFERGTSRTAHAMATRMVRLVADRIAGRDR